MTEEKIEKGTELLESMKTIRVCQSHLEYMIAQNVYPALWIRSGSYSDWNVRIPHSCLDKIFDIIRKTYAKMLEEKQKEFDKL